jgi:hypothetical protein
VRKLFLVPLIAALLLLILAAAASAAPLAAPWNGQPISPGIGPTYGEPWPVPVPSDEAVANLQGPPHDTSTLAVMPYADVAPELAKFQAEAKAAGIPARMTWWVTGKSAGGRDMYAVVINALETGAQRSAYQRWQNLRSKELINPAVAQTLLSAWGDKVKMPIYIEADINGNEYEGTDAMMQVIRDLTITPLGTNTAVDKILNHSILVIVPTSNPDGRVMGTRGNGGGPDLIPGVADTNRDYFVQSQPEEQIDAAIQQQYLATGALHLHGYVNPMLVDGDTKPLNPGTDAVNYYTWNTKRVTQTESDFTAAGFGLQSPVLDWNASGNIPTTYTIAAAPAGATETGTTVTITTTASNSSQLSVGYTVIVAGVAEAGYNGTFVITGKPSSTTFTYTATTSGLPASGGGTAVSPAGPSYAQTWDGWGPFYGQTYMEFLGVDSSTCEMSDNSTVEGNPGTQVSGRLKAKVEQYLDFYSAASYWLDNQQSMMSDQLAMFRRGIENAPTDPNAFADSSYLSGLGFTDAANNWMIQYPTAYIIPFGAGQRSDAEANRLVDWLLKNGVQVERAQKAFTWNGTMFEAGSYVVSMSQALRAIAWNALAAGTDIESGISILYASPAAWSHGLLWGADTVEVPRGDATFKPMTKPISAPNTLVGGVRGGLSAPAAFYSVTLKGVREDQAILGVLKSGVAAEMAEAPFTSTTGGAMPAGTLIFPADKSTAAALDAAGKASGMWVERNVGVAKPQTTKVGEAPKVAILVTSVPNPASSNSDSAGVLKELFGDAGAQYVATTTGANSLQNAADDPLAGYDVIYNLGAGWPSSTNATAQARLTAFFARGGGYIAGNASTSNFTFLSGAGLVSGSLTQSSQSAYGGIAQWVNTGAQNSPISGAYPGTDFMFLPSNTTYFTALPLGAVTDGQYPSNIATIGPQNGYVAGMWLNRLAPANSAPVLIHGTTTLSGRYVACATNPFSRYDAEREWPLIVQAALWSDLTD